MQFKAKDKSLMKKLISNISLRAILSIRKTTIALNNGWLKEGGPTRD
jgi:hypothetical protein